MADFHRLFAATLSIRCRAGSSGAADGSEKPHAATRRYPRLFHPAVPDIEDTQCSLLGDPAHLLLGRQGSLDRSHFGSVGILQPSTAQAPEVHLSRVNSNQWITNETPWPNANGSNQIHVEMPIIAGLSGEGSALITAWLEVG
jgi:hypothetical protein